MPGAVASALLIRAYEARDAAAVWALHVAALSAIGALYPGPWDEDFQRISEVYVEPGGTFLVGELDGSIVAMGALRCIATATAEIKRMRIQPGLQRCGYGSLILQALERHAAQRGLWRLQLDTTTEQHAARAFYEKHGYRAVEVRRAAHADQVLYEKTLDRPPGDVPDTLS
jgi:GNAT superfamily N-acetyltransferase